ncbi:MAG TPA: hypothetical protein VFI42_17795 [Thermomicrobiaceae bacterium]|nr:hypothetical protein [Thermomicrobiaceae bacterium]
MSVDAGAGSGVVAELRALRERMLPMLRTIAREYATRSDPGYPVVLDNLAAGYFGLMLDPQYGLYFMTDGERVIAQLSIVGWRGDVRSSAQKEKFSSLPFDGVRPVSSALSDNQLRNLLAELLSHWNTQPLIIRVTDS